MISILFFTFHFRCFLLLLLLAAVLWKIKQKYDMYRRRQRLFVEMEQMASRPFSEVSVRIRLTFFYIQQKQQFNTFIEFEKVLVEIENRRPDDESPTPVIENISKAQRKRKKVNG